MLIPVFWFTSPRTYFFQMTRTVLFALNHLDLKRLSPILPNGLKLNIYIYIHTGYIPATYRLHTGYIPVTYPTIPYYTGLPGQYMCCFNVFSVLCFIIITLYIYIYICCIETYIYICDYMCVSRFVWQYSVITYYTYIYIYIYICTCI